MLGAAVPLADPVRATHDLQENLFERRRLALEPFDLDTRVQQPAQDAFRPTRRRSS